MSGSAVVMEQWRTRVPAIVQLWYPGHGGRPRARRRALGRAAPGGGCRSRSRRTPRTCRRSIPTRRDHVRPLARPVEARSRRHAPAFPFGFGLSYTTFALRDAALDGDGSERRVRCTVANTGARDGSEVVQVYAGLPDSRVERRRGGSSASRASRCRPAARAPSRSDFAPDARGAPRRSLVDGARPLCDPGCATRRRSGGAPARRRRRGRRPDRTLSASGTALAEPTSAARCMRGAHSQYVPEPRRRKRVAHARRDARRIRRRAWGTRVALRVPRPGRGGGGCGDASVGRTLARRWISPDVVAVVRRTRGGSRRSVRADGTSRSNGRAARTPIGGSRCPEPRIRPRRRSATRWSGRSSRARSRWSARRRPLPGEARYAYTQMNLVTTRVGVGSQYEGALQKLRREDLADRRERTALLRRSDRSSSASARALARGRFATTAPARFAATAAMTDLRDLLDLKRDVRRPATFEFGPIPSATDRRARVARRSTPAGSPPRPAKRSWRCSTRPTRRTARCPSGAAGSSPGRGTASSPRRTSPTSRARGRDPGAPSSP
jgi:hypothetical protein